MFSTLNIDLSILEQRNGVGYRQDISKYQTIMSTREEKILTEAGEFQRPTYGSATNRKSPMVEESDQNFDVGSSNNNSEDLINSGRQHYFNRFSFFTNFPRRYYLVILAFLGFFNLYAMRVNLSVAILYMTTNRTIVYPDGSSTF
uniref:Uncharacterized protein n=1 Tax=Romanomermis culicivorax TaxID=13658 RepID=A0A915KBR7_ROMCU